MGVGWGGQEALCSSLGWEFDFFWGVTNRFFGGEENFLAYSLFCIFIIIIIITIISISISLVTWLNSLYLKPQVFPFACSSSQIRWGGRGRVRERLSSA